MNKKVFRIVFAIACAALVVTGVVLQFTRRGGSYPTPPIALSMVGLFISMEYKGEKRRALVRALQALAVLIILATPIGWFAPINPEGRSIYYIVLNIGAIICNVPMAFIGFQRKKSTAREE